MNNEETPVNPDAVSSGPTLRRSTRVSSRGPESPARVTRSSIRVTTPSKTTARKTASSSVVTGSKKPATPRKSTKTDTEKASSSRRSAINCEDESEKSTSMPVKRASSETNLSKASSSPTDRRLLRSESVSPTLMSPATRTRRKSIVSSHQNRPNGPSVSVPSLNEISEEDEERIGGVGSPSGSVRRSSIGGTPTKSTSLRNISKIGTPPSGSPGAKGTTTPQKKRSSLDGIERLSSSPEVLSGGSRIAKRALPSRSAAVVNSKEVFNGTVKGDDSGKQGSKLSTEKASDEQISSANAPVKSEVQPTVKLSTVSSQDDPEGATGDAVDIESKPPKIHLEEKSEPNSSEKRTEKTSEVHASVTVSDEVDDISAKSSQDNPATVDKAKIKSKLGTRRSSRIHPPKEEALQNVTLADVPEVPEVHPEPVAETEASNASQPAETVKESPSPQKKSSCSDDVEVKSSEIVRDVDPKEEPLNPEKSQINEVPSEAKNISPKSAQVGTGADEPLIESEPDKIQPQEEKFAKKADVEDNPKPSEVRPILESLPRSKESAKSTSETSQKDIEDSVAPVSSQNPSAQSQKEESGVKSADDSEAVIQLELQSTDEPEASAKAAGRSTLFTTPEKGALEEEVNSASIACLSDTKIEQSEPVETQMKEVPSEATNVSPKSARLEPAADEDLHESKLVETKQQEDNPSAKPVVQDNPEDTQSEVPSKIPVQKVIEESASITVMSVTSSEKTAIMKPGSPLNPVAQPPKKETTQNVKSAAEAAKYVEPQSTGETNASNKSTSSEAEVEATSLAPDAEEINLVKTVQVPKLEEKKIEEVPSEVTSIPPKSASVEPVSADEIESKLVETVSQEENQTSAAPVVQDKSEFPETELTLPGRKLTEMSEEPSSPKQEVIPDDPQLPEARSTEEKNKLKDAAVSSPSEKLGAPSETEDNKSQKSASSNGSPGFSSPDSASDADEKTEVKGWTSSASEKSTKPVTESQAMKMLGLPESKSSVDLKPQVPRKSKSRSPEPIEDVSLSKAMKLEEAGIDNDASSASKSPSASPQTSTIEKEPASSQNADDDSVLSLQIAEADVIEAQKETLEKREKKKKPDSPPANSDELAGGKENNETRKRTGTFTTRRNIKKPKFIVSPLSEVHYVPSPVYTVILCNVPGHAVKDDVRRALDKLSLRDISRIYKKDKLWIVDFLTEESLLEAKEYYDKITIHGVRSFLLLVGSGTLTSDAHAAANGATSLLENGHNETSMKQKSYQVVISGVPVSASKKQILRDLNGQNFDTVQQIHAAKPALNSGKTSMKLCVTFTSKKVKNAIKEGRIFHIGDAQVKMKMLKEITCSDN